MYHMQIISHDDLTEVRLSGEVGFGETEELERAISDATTPGANLLLDCEGLSFADSSFLRLLLQLDRDVRNRGTNFRIKNVSRTVSKLFTCTGLEKHFDWSMKAAV